LSSSSAAFFPSLEPRNSSVRSRYIVTKSYLTNQLAAFQNVCSTQSTTTTKQKTNIMQQHIHSNIFVGSPTCFGCFLAVAILAQAARRGFCCVGQVSVVCPTVGNMADDLETLLSRFGDHPSGSVDAEPSEAESCSDAVTTPRTCRRGDVLPIECDRANAIMNWDMFATRIPMGGRETWTAAPNGILDMRNVTASGGSLPAGDLLQSCVDTASWALTCEGAVEHKIGMAQNMFCRWQDYMKNDVFTHLIVIASMSTRESAAVLEAAMIFILHARGHTMWSRNYATRDRGGTGPMGAHLADLCTHVYIAVRNVNPLAERPRLPGERKRLRGNAS
jgi:hypothetical protein